MRPLHELHLMLSARLLQATIEFHSRMKGELSAFAEQVLLYFLMVLIFVNCLFFNCHVMLRDAVYGDFATVFALCLMFLSRIAIFAQFFRLSSPVFRRSACSSGC